MKRITILLFVQTVFSLAITSAPTLNKLIRVTATSPLSPVQHVTWSTLTPSVTEIQLPIIPSAVITLAPLVGNPLERRQRCWDDRGFSVDCATWTGYYYTWGPPGNPYEGGPGEGGGGSGGNGEGSVVVSQSDTGRVHLTAWSLILDSNIGFDLNYLILEDLHQKHNEVRPPLKKGAATR
ncbi:hypothetical protein PV08_08497 [Exophiala spinifera]|uniref:Uncharacterized protein n=1 Tax=Exophiala spinifera TaxID=91928 RepID=A0A0D2BQA1_9EURO|nr:uncharacterized protein PV08_08497 [Exophiala spinifera]KIW13309.1 hypothetical protein PV08_08497 [Exophiala spinifera]